MAEHAVACPATSRASSTGPGSTGIWNFQLADQVWASGREMAQRMAVERCSAVGVARSGTRPAVVAQNVDVEGFRKGFQTVLHMAEEGGRLEQFVFTFAGDEPQRHGDTEKAVKPSVFFLRASVPLWLIFTVHFLGFTVL